MWSGWGDSNSRPPAPKAGALTKLRYTPYVGGQPIAAIVDGESPPDVSDRVSPTHYRWPTVREST